MENPTYPEIGKITISRQVFDLINGMPQNYFKDLCAMLVSYAFAGKTVEPDYDNSESLFNAIRPFVDMDLEATRNRNNHLRQIAIDRWQGKSKKSKKEKRQAEAAQRSVFIPPTLEEVRAYVSEIGANIDPSYFYNYYKAVGWMVGRNKMKDWHSAVRSWKDRNREKRGADPGRNGGRRAPWSAPVSAPEDFKDKWD